MPSPQPTLNQTLTYSILNTIYHPHLFFPTSGASLLATGNSPSFVAWNIALSILSIFTYQIRHFFFHSKS